MRVVHACSEPLGLGCATWAKHSKVGAVRQPALLGISGSFTGQQECFQHQLKCHTEKPYVKLKMGLQNDLLCRHLGIHFFPKEEENVISFPIQADLNAGDEDSELFPMKLRVCCPIEWVVW